MSKKVLITGAGSGLGLALAKQCAARGDTVLLADLRADRLRSALAELSQVARSTVDKQVSQAARSAIDKQVSQATRSAIDKQVSQATRSAIDQQLKDGEHSTHQLDVGDSSAWAKLAQSLHAQGCKLDLLINNAGIASSGEFIGTSDEEWERVMRINVSSIQYGCRSMLPLMLGQTEAKQAKPGPFKAAIINVASMAGLAGAPDTGVYGVAKAAVVAYSEILRAQVYAQGIHVSCLCPSFFRTNLLESFTPGHERMHKTASKLMDSSKLTADDVAAYALRSTERGEFLLLPHAETRKMWRLKRWFPELYFRQMLKFLKRMRVKP
jgi:NAD(P)-dependent dehydrogenase (short-subunit alcohol dehydrogenase family)